MEINIKKLKSARNLLIGVLLNIFSRVIVKVVRDLRTSLIKLLIHNSRPRSHLRFRPLPSNQPRGRLAVSRHFPKVVLIIRTLRVTLDPPRI
jgi:hypothetical protein